MAVGMWKPAVGGETAAVRLAKVWSVIAFGVFLACLDYESNAFEKGVEPAALVCAGQVLQAPFEIDPRGGFLGQEAFEEGLVLTLASSAALKVHFEEAAASKGIATGVIVTLCAFKIGVMLSHLRIKRRAWLKQDSATKSLADHSLVALYHSIDSASSPGKATNTKAPNPFSNFRDVSESENEAELEQDDGLVKAVATYFDPALQHAINLMSDGRVIQASKYTAHHDGFIKAEWHDDEGNVLNTFDCEIPNGCLVHGLIVTAPPKALVNAGDGDKGEGEGEESDTAPTCKPAGSFKRPAAAAKNIARKRPAKAEKEAESSEAHPKVKPFESL